MSMSIKLYALYKTGSQVERIIIDMGGKLYYVTGPGHIKKCPKQDLKYFQSRNFSLCTYDIVLKDVVPIAGTLL